MVQLILLKEAFTILNQHRQNDEQVPGGKAGHQGVFGNPDDILVFKGIGRDVQINKISSLTKASPMICKRAQSSPKKRPVTTPSKSPIKILVDKLKRNLFFVSEAIRLLLLGCIGFYSADG
jgi:hypothetical protein